MVSGRAPHSERPALLLAGATHGVAEPSDNGGGRFLHEGWGREGGAMGERMRLRRRQPIREEGGGFDLRVREKMQSGRSILCESNDWGSLTL